MITGSNRNRPGRMRTGGLVPDAMSSCVQKSRPACRNPASVRFVQGRTPSQAHALTDQTSDVGRERTVGYGTNGSEKLTFPMHHQL